MEVGKVVVLLLIIFSAKAFANTRLIPSCREHKDFKVLVDITDHIFDESGTRLVKKELNRRGLVRHYSNLSDVLGKLYFEYSTPMNKPDTVKVLYFKGLAEVKDMRKSYKLKKASKNLLVVDGFDFKKEFHAKESKPIDQKFVFMRGAREVCRIKVEQMFAIEY